MPKPNNFEENLSIEVKIIKQKTNQQIDLIELNLNDNVSRKREVKAFTKNETNKKLKIFKKEIKILKRILKGKIRTKKLQKK